MALHPLPPDAIDAALAEAERQRTLGNGLLVESICLDVLDVDETHTRAVSLLVRTVAERRDSVRLRVATGRVETWVAALDDPYERALLTGMLAEQRALAAVSERVPGFVVRDWFAKAQRHYEEALEVRSTTEALLRRNAVVRILAENADLKPVDR